MLLPRGDQALEQEQLVGAHPERRQNPSEAAARAEEAPHSGIGVNHSESLVERSARGEAVAERGEPGDFAAEVEGRRRRRRYLQGIGGDSSDAAT